MIPPSKYRSQWTVYKGIKYASKREAKHAAELDLLVCAKEIKGWLRQVSVPLVVNDVRICSYVIDFVVELNGGSYEYHEVKGYPTDVWKLKFALFKALYPERVIKVIK